MMITSVAPFILGIAGGTGSGKRALSIALRQKYFQVGTCLIEQDSYYLDRSHLSALERAGINYDEPQAIEHDLLLQHLGCFISRQTD